MHELRRTYRFCASVCLRRPDWDDALNAGVFGPGSRPPGHGHNYRLTLVLRGRPDPETGSLVDLDRLDDAVEDRVVRPYDHKNVNLDVPGFETRVPTLEAILEDHWARLSDLAVGGTLVRLILCQDEFLTCSYPTT